MPLGLPGGMPGAMPPGFGGPPGAMPPGFGGQGTPSSEDAFAALSKLTPRSPHPTEATTRIREGLDLAHRIIMAILPQVMVLNPKLTKDLHGIGQRLQAAKTDLMREAPLAPPPDLMLGMGGGGAGGVSMGSPSLPGMTGGGALP